MSDATTAHILIVDDNEVNRDVLGLHLQMRGFQYTMAESGAQALELLNIQHDARLVKPHQQEFDLVLLDIMMPEISGLDVLRTTRQHYTRADLPIIMVTAKDSSEDVVESLEAGANDFITKPIDFPVLFARVDAALHLHSLSRQKDEFLAIASHDLKNPLAVVRGFTKMVQTLVPEGEPMTGEALDMLRRVFRQTNAMESIISDFLDFHALQEGRLSLSLQGLDLGHAVREAADTQQSYAREKGISLEVSVPEGLPKVDADPNRIQQVLTNFIGNAIKYGTRGGKVQVSLQGEGGHATVRVTDDGPGIPAGEQDRLFLKYGRLSNRPTGGEKSSGLGLFIAKQIIDLHAGRIGARNNTPQPGATFWFELPLKTA